MAETKDKKKELPWSAYSEAEKEELETLSKGYIEFLTKCKTERESVREIIRQAQAAGYEDLEEIVRSGQKLAPGAKVYCAYMKKAIALFHVGTEPLENGLAILGAHIDTCPLYEDGGLAYLDTHYYGGIKKYQWVTVPLALHGVVAKKDGTVQDIVIGEEASEPTFCVTDLLVHLSQEQLKKSADKVVEGEKLDVLVGTLPLAGEEKDAVQKNVLHLLQEKYGIEEDDFLSAELSFVPAGAAREMGFDRSMILGYGQDDRVCSYTSLAAMLETKPSKRTACCLLVDKEEIGSVGATGMRSHFFENMLAELMNALGQYSELAVRRALASSKMLSSDVSSGYDALYAEAFDKRNVAYLGRGMVFNKFTGSRGKSGSNDANAEYLGELRAMLDTRGVRYQSAELGKVDLGGGGTIAYIMALYGMQVIDSGVAVLSMHAPWEVTSKVDVYEVKKGYAAFLAQA